MKGTNKLKGLDGMEYICSVPKGEKIIALATCQDRLFVATDKDLYVLADEKRLEKIDISD